MHNSPKVFLDELPWDMRSRNTDWRYVRFSLPMLAEYEDITLIQQRSRWVTLAGNVKALRTALGWRVGLPLSYRAQNTSKLAAAEVTSSGANVIFAHRAYPLNAGDIPVVWQSAILDPEMQQSYGVTAADLQEQMEVKRELFARAAAVQVSTQAEAARHDAMFPELAGRFVPVPFFTPHVQSCSLEALDRHTATGPVRILFAGNNAQRKGLDLLLEGFLSLPRALQSQAELIVMSNFDRSPMTLPTHERITILRGEGPQRVLEEMARSHIFVNVARFESYGVVFHEAMSQGAVCLAPNWEVQRELFDDGRAGMLLPCTAVAIRQALERLIVDPEMRARMALAAWERFRARYAPAVVAKQYADLFRRVLRD